MSCGWIGAGEPANDVSSDHSFYGSWPLGAGCNLVGPVEGFKELLLYGE